MYRLFALILAGSLFLVSAQAGEVRSRQKKQQARIADGVKDKELTARETVKLERKEAQLQRQIHRDRVDGGGLTPKERAKIDKKQDKLSREIYKEKHDNQTRK